jgi:hypothetical protein
MKMLGTASNQSGKAVFLDNVDQLIVKNNIIAPKSGRWSTGCSMTDGEYLLRIAAKESGVRA